jgi:ABC-type Zn uptake system ZnuABC Zn-binding protein ZnuA
VLIVNGAGFEEWLQRVLDNAGGTRLIVEAAQGLTSREPREGEAVMEDTATGDADHHHDEGDPHFWLDPTHVERYVANIRDGLIQADPAGKAVYEQNAAAYITKLQDLDKWIQGQVSAIPAQRRLLVTNHESFGYYADRYGFKIAGSVIPSVSTNASPSAQQLARLTDAIRAATAPAIFLETGSNPELAQQLATETGIKIVTDLYTHSLTPAGGNAPTYLDMMRYNTQQIVNALK